MCAPAMFTKRRLNLFMIGIGQTSFLVAAYMHTIVCGVLTVLSNAGGVSRLDNNTLGEVIRVERCMDVRHVGECVGEVSGVVS